MESVKLKICLWFCDIVLLWVTVGHVCIVLCIALALYCVMLVMFVLPPIDCTYCT
jgi:hypothetical protein